MNNITIEFCPEDRARIDRLIAAMERKACEKCVESALEAMSVAHETAQPVQSAAPAVVQPSPVVPPVAPATTPVVPAVAPVAPVATPAAPVQSVPYATPTSTPMPAVAPVPPMTPVIPTGSVSYDMDTIARAGSALIDQNPANVGKLMGLLAKYGTNAITSLPKEHYGAFVTDLRALGASI